MQKYARFRRDIEQEAAHSALPTAVLAALPGLGVDEPEDERTFSLEKDLQAALRASITQLEAGLSVIDGGSERSVPSGRIDILARDQAGAVVVIELKAVKAPRDAVAQVLAYMGDIQAEMGGSVRGILVAPSFDTRAVSASRVVPTLSLCTYHFSFSFAKLS